MPAQPENELRVVIACGGTGGHLFPGLAVGDQLRARGCEVTLLISPKEVDQQAVKQVDGMEIVTLPAVGLAAGSRIAFLRGFFQSYRAARKLFRRQAPNAALAMGGFTSAPPILAARAKGARTYLHESNFVPGRANRWLSWVVKRSFVGFEACATRLHSRQVTVSGTPVRPNFQPRNAGECRIALGLAPDRPVALVTGGSQGAIGLNDLVLSSLPYLSSKAPELQWFHLTGPHDAKKVAAAYQAQGLKAVVHPFFDRMELALGAASVAISRAGASSLAELAAMQVPAILVPYPAATDNHQFHNARAFLESGAARLIEQRGAKPEELGRVLMELMQNPEQREQMRLALAKWHVPNAAKDIAQVILEELPRTRTEKNALPRETPDRLPAVIA